MSRHRDHVQQVLEMAKFNYVKDGYLAPTLLMCGRRDALVVMMAPSPELAPNFARVAGALYCTRRTTDLVVNIVEAWGRAYPKDGSEVENLRHGDLGRAAEAGDPNVYTVLVIQAVDTHDSAEDVTVTYTVDGPEAGSEMWVEGEAEGRMPEMMRDALHAARSITVPPEMDTQVALEVMATLGLVDAALEPLVWEEGGTTAS